MYSCLKWIDMPTGEQPHKKKTMRPKDLPHLGGVERVFQKNCQK